MIISHGRQYIFVHIPKTGGTSLALALEAKAMKDDILIGDTPKAKQRRKRLRSVQTSGRIWKHSGLSDIVGLVEQDDLTNYFVFTIVRNPWDRLVSYYHWLQEQSFSHQAVSLAKSHDFSAFLHHPHITASVRHAPYGSYVRDSNGVELCNLFLRLEHLGQDIPKLEARLGMRLPTVQHVNSSSRKRDWRGYYGDAEAAHLADICAEDIARFNYGFDD